MSALPPKAELVQPSRDVRFVPKADIDNCSGVFPGNPELLRVALTKLCLEQWTLEAGWPICFGSKVTANTFVTRIV
jgi:hypothetical protein